MVRVSREKGEDAGRQAGKFLVGYFFSGFRRLAVESDDHLTIDADAAEARIHAATVTNQFLDCSGIGRVGEDAVFGFRRENGIKRGCKNFGPCNRESSEGGLRGIHWSSLVKYSSMLIRTTF